MHARLAYIVFIDGGNAPGIDNSLPGGQGGVPGYPLPTPPGYPGQGLPPFPSQGLPTPHPPHYPGQGLPGIPGYPSQGLPPFPSQGLPGLPTPPVTPDNTLPPGPPPVASLPIVLPTPPPVGPGDPTRKFELKYSPLYGWVLVPVDEDGTAEPK
jgi:hypothetical protein